MVEMRGDRSWSNAQDFFLCMSWVQSLKCETQLSVPGHFPYLEHLPIDYPSQGTLSTLPDTASSSSAHRYTHPALAPLHIVLFLP